jgi:microcystin-dependent protein
VKRKFLAAAGALLIGLVAYTFVPPPKPAAATFIDQLTFGGTSGGSANAQTFTIPNLTANTPGVQLRFIPGFTNTGPTQINVSGIGLVNVLRPSSIGNVGFSGGEFQTGELTCVTFNGTAYQLACNVDITPIGKMVPFRGSAAPRGTLIEDGSCVSQTTYAPLFSVIGTTYGTCGTGLFMLPDSRGSIFAALDTQGVNGAANRLTNAGSGCTATSVAFRCGTQNQTLTLAQIPAGITSNGSSGGTSFLGGTSTAGALPGSGGTGVGVQNSGAFLSAVSVNSTSNNTGGLAHPIVPPVLGGISAIKY